MWNPYTTKSAFIDFNFSLWFTISLNCDVRGLSETGPWELSKKQGLASSYAVLRGNKTTLIILNPLRLEPNGRYLQMAFSCAFCLKTLSCVLFRILQQFVVWVKLSINFATWFWFVFNPDACEWYDYINLWYLWKRNFILIYARVHTKTNMHMIREWVSNYIRV